MANKVSLAKGFLKLAAPLSALLAIAFAWQSYSMGSAAAAQAREVRVVSTSGVSGQTVNFSVELVAQGNENALGFSLNFDPAVFSNPIATIGSGASGASVNINTLQAGNGRLGIALAMSTGQTFAAGTRQLVVVTLTIAGNAPAGTSPITFGDAPIAREVSDVNANVLTTLFTQGTITVQQPNPVPAITSLSPNSATAGTSAFTLTVNGTGFVGASTVWWNGSQRTTQFVSATQLTASISAADIATAGTVSVVVNNPAPGGGSSSAATFTINNPAPAITSLSPNSALTGGAAFTLTINGTGFVNASSVWWNGSPRTTQFVSATQLTASIPASDIASAGTASVVVQNPAPGGGSSPAATFSINNPSPAITSLSPNSTLVGGAAFTLTINGMGFINASTVWWNGSQRTTQFVSATQLTASIPATDIATVGTASVVVQNPSPGGGSSPASTFTINNPAPAITSLSPNSATAGGAAFTLTINGTGFISASSVWWNGSQRTTQFVSATQLTASIPASDIASAGTASVVVQNPSPGGGSSPAATFTISPVIAPTPTTTSISPSVAVAGGAAFPLTVNGTNFTATSTVNWNGSPRTTQFVSATQLTAAILAADIATAGTVAVTVVTPAPGGGTSNAQTFTIASPVASVSAASFLGAELAPESIVAAFGVNLATSVAIADATPLPTTLAGSKVMVKDSLGVERLSPLFFVAPGQINYQMPPGTATGTASVTVVSGDNKISIGSQQIASVAPGLFTANVSGEGVPAANVFRLKANGEQSTEVLSTFDAGSGRFVPIPIDLGPSGEQVFGIFYGTGVRNASLSDVSANIGGVSCEVLYAGVTPGFIGLDQFNIRLERALIGRGNVDVVITVKGKVANTVRINIK